MATKMSSAKKVTGRTTESSRIWLGGKGYPRRGIPPLDGGVHRQVDSLNRYVGRGGGVTGRNLKSP